MQINKLKIYDYRDETILITLIREDDVIVLNGSVELKANDTVLAPTNEKGQFALNALFSK
ncbi:hypothetical protein MGH68_14580 [Erysipelothrix sp. D19-032]